MILFTRRHRYFTQLPDLADQRMAAPSSFSFPSSLSDKHLERYFRVIREGIAVQSHSDLLRWLQGEIQHYLPHEIMLAVWKDAGANCLRHDIVSVLPGVRTEHLHSKNLLALQRGLYSCWVELGKAPYKLSLGACGFRLETTAAMRFSRSLKRMRLCSCTVSATNAEARTASMYIQFRHNLSDPAGRDGNLLPYLDTALARSGPGWSE